jgi:hypothetical protein
VPNKYAHVKKDTVPAKDCAWPHCKALIPKSHCMCEQHWGMLPKALRDAIWYLYEAGQENAPEEISEAYTGALQEAQEWARSYDLMLTDQPAGRSL